MGSECSTNGSEEESILDFVEKAKRKVGGPTCRWEEDNIKMDVRETGWGCIDWID
jgi:hypothetical protein